MSKCSRAVRKIASLFLFSALFLNFYLVDQDTVNYMASVASIPSGDVTYKTASTSSKKRYLTYKTYEDIPVKRTEDKSYCTMPESAGEKPNYQGELVKSALSGNVNPNQMFRVKVYVKNTGTARWYSDKSGCKDQLPTRLGTRKDQDRQSKFWTDAQLQNSGWVLDQNKNRVEMTQNYIDPGETAIFSFWSLAPDKPGLYREYFLPVVEGKQWFENTADFYVDIPIGEVSQEDYDKMKLADITMDTIQLQGPKNLDVRLSVQQLHLKYGSTVIKTFSISSGKRKTPTPTGSHEIRFKQNVRVASKPPYYVMPNFQGFAKSGGIWRGFGFHALPSLANDGGVFWTEALNHIGIPVSHGCIRLLPEDAKTLFNWSDVGMKMEIYN